MNSDNSLNSKRISFFKRIREQLDSGTEPTVWSTELEELWPGDENAAHSAFSQEDLHMVWEDVRNPDPDLPQ